MGDATNSNTDNAASSVDPNYALASFQEREGEYISVFERFLSQWYAPDMQRLYTSLTQSSSSFPFGRRPSSSSIEGASTTSTAATSDASQQCFALSLRICAQLLIDASPRLAALLFRFPDEFLPLFHRALASQVTLLSHSDGIATLPVKTRQKVKIRVDFLPPIGLLRKPTISTIRSSDVKRLIQVAGTVVRTGMIKMQETSREVVCGSATCQYRFLVKCDLEQGNLLEMPRICPSDSSGSTKKPCKSTHFDVIESSRVVSDHQVIKIQEQVSKLGVGSIPRSILVVLEDDLVDAVKAGDHVVVVGVLMRCWKPCIPSVRCDLETIVRANSIRVQNASSANVLVTEELKNEFTRFWKHHQLANSAMQGRNEIIASICPKVYGLFIVKLALALTIIGGCSHTDATGMKTRGEPHMLLIGDPGTGKSQFLRFAAELSPRSVLTTGIGTTSAGLTCTAVKDGSEWMLEAGALVLADKGVCCIDEFSSIRAHDRTSIHEAMEQQTLSVAKAGLVCKLNARTTIFAVTNPKGQYDPNADISVNTSIASPLLSRFDLILVLLDRRNAHWDQVVSSFILKQSTDDLPAATTTSSSSVKEEEKDESLLWSVPKLQAYICFVKDKLQPQLTRSAMSILQRYYQLQRASETRSASRTTIRLLESLTRLAQAHARLLFHDHVDVVDAVVAVFLMEVSKTTDGSSSSSLLGGGAAGGGLDSVLHSDFSEDPTAEYAFQEKMVLEYLGLSELATVEDAGEEDEHTRTSTSQGGGGGGRGGGRAHRSKYEQDEQEEEKHSSVSAESSFGERFGGGQKRARPPTSASPSSFQWRAPVATTSSSSWKRGGATTGSSPFGVMENEEVAGGDEEDEEEMDDEYLRRAKRMSQAEDGKRTVASSSSQAEPLPSQSQSQSLWRRTMGQSRVQRWSQMASQGQADTNGGGGSQGEGDGGGGDEEGGEQEGRPVTSKWWRR